MFILDGLLVFQQLALIYIYYSRELDERDPDLANDLGRLCTSMIDYVGSRNHRRTVVHGVKTMEDARKAPIPDAVKQEIRALEKVHIAGKIIDVSLG
jgi:hypothetical protein